MGLLSLKTPPGPNLRVLALIVVGVVVALIARRYVRRANPAPSDPRPRDSRPLEQQDGKCGSPAPPSHPVACPYVGAPAPPPPLEVDYGAPFAGDPGIECIEAGRLVMPTGQLVAADPLVFLNDRAFPVGVAPGTYPVVLARQKDGGDIALALLQVRDTRPVRWEIAVLPGEKPGAHFYPVDSGTGAYVDRAVAQTILARQEAELDRQVRGGKQGERKDLLDLLNESGYAAGPSGNVCIDSDTGGNLIAFRSGAGDGSYGVYIGYDASGTVSAFVTDFGTIDGLDGDSSTAK